MLYSGCITTLLSGNTQQRSMPSMLMLTLQLLCFLGVEESQFSIHTKDRPHAVAVDITYKARQRQVFVSERVQPEANSLTSQFITA